MPKYVLNKDQTSLHKTQNKQADAHDFNRADL